MAKATKAKVKATKITESKEYKAELAKSRQALSDRLKAFGTALRAVEKDGHDIAARIVVHAIRFGDVSLATNMINKFGTDGKSMVRGNMFKGWFEKHGPFRWDKDTKGFKCATERREKMMHHVKDNKTTAKFFGSLMKHTPWEKDPEPEYKGFDLDKEIARLLSRAKKAEKEHGSDPKTKLANMSKLEAFVHSINYPDNENEKTESGDNDNETAAAA